MNYINSLNDIIISLNETYSFDIDQLKKDTNGWYMMSLEWNAVGLSDVMGNVDSVELIDNSMLGFFSDRSCASPDKFFKNNVMYPDRRACTLMHIKAIYDSDFELLLKNTPVEKVVLQDYITKTCVKNFNRFSTKLSEGDLISFKLKYYNFKTVNKHNIRETSGLTAVGFVTCFTDNQLSIHYRKQDNTMSRIDLHPNDIESFDWYIIDENRYIDGSNERTKNHES